MRKDARQFARWLDMTMENRGLTNRALASEIGVHDSVVSRWRSGRTMPGMENLDKIATLMEVDVVQLAATAGYMETHQDIQPLPTPRPTAVRARIRQQLEQVKGLTRGNIDAALESWDEEFGGSTS